MHMVSDPVAEYLATACGYLSFPSISVGVIRRGEPLRTYGVPAGMAGAPAYKVGSLTKLITALAVLELENDGRVRLHDPVSRYLPWFRAPGRAAEAVTILDLMRHTAGLPRGDVFLYNPTASEVEAVLRRAESAAPVRRPRGEYSNLGYVLLGLVIEAASGTPYGSFVARRLLEPLEMRDSGFGAAGPGAQLAAPNCLSCFRPESTCPCDCRPMPLLGAPHASHDLISTVPDFSVLLSRLLGGGPAAAEKVISARSAARLLGSAWPPSGRLRTGPGFRHLEGRHGGVYFENGEHFGHSASMLLIPARGFALIAMVNRGSAGLDLWYVLNTLTAYYLDGLDPARLNFAYEGAAAIAGEYATASGWSLVLTVRDGGVYASVNDEPPSPFIYKGQHCFIKPTGLCGRYGFRLDPHTGPDHGFCAGPHYFFRRGGGGDVGADDPYPALAGIYAHPAAGRVALFTRRGRLVLAFAPFKEAELTEAGPAAFVQRTGPFRGERVHVRGDDSTVRIGTLTFTKIPGSW